MDLVTCMKHDKYCMGHKEIKLCNMCLNKEINVYLDSLPVDQTVEIKEGMHMIDTFTCKATNASYYTSKQTT